MNQGSHSGTVFIMRVDLMKSDTFYEKSILLMKKIFFLSGRHFESEGVPITAVGPGTSLKLDSLSGQEKKPLPYG